MTDEERPEDRDLGLEQSPQPDPDTPRCPTCGTALLAVERDRLLAKLPSPPPGWTITRDHLHDYWANVEYKFNRMHILRVIIVHLAGRNPNNEQLIEGTITVTYRSWTGPPRAMSSVAEQWSFLKEDVEGVAAKVCERFNVG